MKTSGRKFLPAFMIACILLPSHGSALDQFGDLGRVAATSSGSPASKPADGQSGLAGWNITYMVPPGWQVAQTLGRTQILSSDASGYTGSAGQAMSNADQGTYTVIGTSLVFRGTRGSLPLTFHSKAIGLSREARPTGATEQ